MIYFLQRLAMPSVSNQDQRLSRKAMILNLIHCDTGKTLQVRVHWRKILAVRALIEHKHTFRVKVSFTWCFTEMYMYNYLVFGVFFPCRAARARCENSSEESGLNRSLGLGHLQNHFSPLIESQPGLFNSKSHQICIRLCEIHDRSSAFSDMSFYVVFLYFIGTFHRQ